MNGRIDRQIDSDMRASLLFHQGAKHNLSLTHLLNAKVNKFTSKQTRNSRGQNCM